MAKHKVRIGKKEKQVDDNSLKETRPWPDLPHQLVKLIGKQLSLLEYVSFGGVSKTWRAAPRRCNPTRQATWLVLSEHESSRTHNIVSMPLHIWYWKRRYKDPWKYCVGSSHGKLVMRGTKPSQYFLLLQLGFFGSITYRTLPTWDSNVHFGHVVLSSSPNPVTDCTMLVLTGGSYPGFMFYKFREHAWIKEDCTLVDPNSSCEPRAIQFTNAIGFRGRFYALSLQGTLAVIDVDSHPRVTLMGARRAIPSTWSRSFREYLVESCGEILVIFLISRKSTDIVDTIEVFQLDLSKPSWIKMGSLGDRTLFVGISCCMSVSAHELGCRSNCIYFTNLTIDGWWVLNMEDGSISPGWDTGSIHKSPVWTAPCS